MSDAVGTGGNPSPVSALDHRLMQAGLIAPQTSTLAVRTGVLVAPGSTALVTGTSATGTMTVSIAAHHWVTTRGTADGVYIGAKEAAGTVNIAAAPGANSRIDVIYVRQKDASSSISPDGASAEEYGVVTGTATASPTKPAFTAAHAGAIELATVQVAAGATSTNGAGVTITNTARLTVARGAALPFRTTAEALATTGSWLGEPGFDMQTKRSLYWDGDEWVKSAGPHELILANPNLGSSGAVSAGGSATVSGGNITVPIRAETGRIDYLFGANPTAGAQITVTLTVNGVSVVSQTANVGTQLPVPLGADLDLAAGTYPWAVTLAVNSGGPVSMSFSGIRITI